LEVEVREVVTRMGNCYGSVMVHGSLSSKGIKVGLKRVQAVCESVPVYLFIQALRVVDPVGAMRRRSEAIKRRRYRVAGPHSLTHLDSNHALIRWKVFFAFLIISDCDSGCH
jgi:hypothetical protein